MNKSFPALGFFFISLPAFSATPVNLSLEPTSFLTLSQTVYADIQLKELKRATDFNKTLHIRIKQNYLGYPVWGSDAVVHIPGRGFSTKALHLSFNKETSMNGIMYRNLKEDLDNTKAHVFEKEQQRASIAHVISLNEGKTFKTEDIQEQESKLMVYVDKNNKAHWAFLVSYYIPSDGNKAPKRPTFIVDAEDFSLYEQWNQVKTHKMVKAGGLGGNHKTGMKMYDGENAPAFIVGRKGDICYMKTDKITLKHAETKKLISFTCDVQNPNHNQLYWNENHDQIETTSSPSNDVMVGAEITRKMYKDWYKIPMLIHKNGKPMHLIAMVHLKDTNAYWDGTQVLFGDSIGSREFNPFTQLDTIAHEISHGFTEQHSNLQYSKQSGGLDESFSDIAGIAAEYYAYGETRFLVGWGDMKSDTEAMRYMDKPSRDCKGRNPGNRCSIDSMNQYYEGLNVHYSSGIFNRAFYQMANAEDWTVRKAFDVMVQANRYYWTETISFQNAACGVKKATQDYQYDLKTVVDAFKTVGIDITTKDCG